ncbi:two-component system, sensor histidine kinase YesM [Gracilibacillus orientalis]|uniref:Two-component system, sensor histidine kinase YesM n=1 Tax=Gracilibacillus orientalis TaxID=334253 RepID=A0A1I4IJ13_9BACI|nr:sensor histidine kinase [Gracilibacillus orientalis]SFL53766.1 two-component system, sensor histidine kinase YesM [Gracilibacillus orientalis]
MNNINVRNKLFITFVLVVFIPVVIVGGYLTNELKNQAIDEAEEQAEVNMERVKERSLEVLKVPIYISNNIMMDYRLEDIVNNNYETTYQVISDYWQYNTFEEYQKIYKSEISNIRFYMDNPTLINNWEIIPVDSNILEKDWYKLAMQNPGVIQWLYIKDETKKDNEYLSLVRRIDFPSYQTNGMLVINLDMKTLTTILSQESSLTMLVDDQHNIIASNSTEQIGHKLNHFIQEEHVLAGETGIFHDQEAEQNRRIFVQPIPLQETDNPLSIISVIEDDKIVKNAHQFGRMGTVLVSITVCIAVILIYIVSKLFSSRLIMLGGQIDRVSKGDFNTRIVIDGNDEIGKLANNLDQMVQNTKMLIRTVEHSNHQKSLLERKQNEIKFKMMASQINPHFLFNCLESIRMEAHYKGEKEIANVVKLLGKLMRNNIEVGTGSIELEREIEVIQWYLDIQKFRYEERLDYSFDIDPATIKLLIPPLIIQPLVENSVIHGLEQNRMGGKVIISSKVMGNQLIITVSDNGIGMSKEKITNIYQVLDKREEQPGVRIGLRNVHQRLKLLYGESSGLMITSKEGVGTSISFSIILGGDKIVEGNHSR